MRKLLALLCAVTMLATCVTSLTAVTADTVTFPYEETFNGEYVEVDDAEWGDADGNMYQHTLQVPLGWDYRPTCSPSQNTAFYGQAQNTESDRRRATVYTADDGEVYLGMTGSDLAITKMLDIEPGYEYTITTEVYTKSKTARSALSYWLYNADEEGNYTEINEYLSSLNADTLSYAEGHEIFDATGRTDFVAWDQSDSVITDTLTITVSVTDENVNAIMIGLGGFGGNSDSRNFSVFHDGFTITKNKAVDLVENKTYYYADTFTDVYEDTEFTATYEGVEYVNGINIPEGWSYSIDGLYPVHIKEISEKYVANGRIIAGYWSGAPYNGNAFRIWGSVVSLTKMVEVEAGYQYTITTEAAKYGAGTGCRVNTEVVMYHKNEDGSYTEINEYLTKKNGLETVVEGSSKNVCVDTRAEESAMIMTDYYDVTHSVTIDVIDENVDAIMIKLGGKSGCSRDWYGYYKGIKILQGEKVDLVPAKSYYYKEELTNEYTETEFTYNYEGTDYTIGIDVPKGWGYATDGLYPQISAFAAGKYESVGRKIAGYYQGTPYNSYRIWGSWLSLTKMIDVEPGYQYTITTEGAKYGAGTGNRVDTEVVFYHKNEDGSYTEINKYLADNQFQNSIEKPYKRFAVDTRAEEEDMLATDYYDATHSVTVEITDKSVNAIMIKIGGYSGQGQDNYGFYKGIKVTRDKAVDIVPNNQPPYLTLETVSGAKVVRYTPAKGNTTVPTIVIAAYKADEDGTLTLAKVSINKNAATAEGYFEAPYNMDLSTIEGTVKVKAFALDLSKLNPFAGVLTIQ